MPKKPRPVPKLNSIPKVAEQLDVSVKTVRRLIARGDLIAHRIGNLVRVSDDDLRAFLVEQRDD